MDGNTGPDVVQPRRVGRPKGVLNKQTLEQRAFAERVLHGKDGKDKERFENHVREQMYQGTLPPAIFQLLVFYLYGRPVERVELSVPERAPRSPEELKARARALLAAAQEVAAKNDAIDVPVTSTLTQMNEPTVTDDSVRVN